MHFIAPFRPTRRQAALRRQDLYKLTATCVEVAKFCYNMIVLLIKGNGGMLEQSHRV